MDLFSFSFRFSFSLFHLRLFSGFDIIEVTPGKSEGRRFISGGGLFVGGLFLGGCGGGICGRV